MLEKIFFLQLAMSFVLSAKFPSEVSKCNYGDAKCISEIINDIFENKFEGFQRLGLPSLDPLKIGKMDIKQNEKSSVSLTLNFRNISMMGLSKARVYKFSGFNRNPQGDKIDFRFRTPRIVITGPYKCLGRILVLPIQGEGLTNLTLDNIDMMMKFQTKAVKKNDKVYMQLEKSKMNFETTRLYAKFTNLFNGNKALGDNMNMFFNENWQEILAELKAPILDGFGSLFTIIINHVLNSFPYDEMFSN